MEANELKTAILQKTDSELIDFIGQSFYENQSEEKFSKNTIAVKELDSDVINHGISRMKKIEESFDILKILPVVVTFLLAVLAVFSQLTARMLEPFKDVNPDFVNLLILLGFFVLLTFQISNIRSIRSYTSYFKSLLELHKD